MAVGDAAGQRKRAVQFWVLASMRSLAAVGEVVSRLHSPPKNGSLLQISFWRAMNPQVCWRNPRNSKTGGEVFGQSDIQSFAAFTPVLGKLVHVIRACRRHSARCLSIT